MNNKLFSIQETANILGVSTKTLRRWDQRGRFVPTRTVGNQRRYTQEQIDQFKVKSSKLKVQSLESKKSAAEVPPLFSENEAPKELKVTHSLPSALSGLPSGSILKNHFLLKRKDEIELSTLKAQGPVETTPATPSLARSHVVRSYLAKLNPLKMGFVFASLVLILSLGGAFALAKYNIVAGLPRLTAGLSKFAGQLAEKRDQFAKFISNLPQISLSIKPHDLSFVPQQDLVGGVLAAATGDSSLILNVNVPSFFSEPVTIGTTTPEPSAILNVVSQDKGFLAPRMTTAQRDVIASPATGLFVYNTDTNHYNMYNGTSWQGVFTVIGDSTTGEAFTETGTSGTALYFYDADGRGKLTTANLSGVRTYTLPDASGEVSLLGQTIANSELVNAKVTVSAGTNMTGGGEVALGSSVTLTLKDSVDLSGTLIVGGAATLKGAAAITGALTANGNVTLGDAATDSITFTGRVAQDADLIPIGTTGTNDLGSSSLPWDNIYADNVFAPSSGTSGYWQRNSQGLSPTNITDDILIGATSTSSAKFGFINVAAGTPTATISGNLSLVVPTTAGANTFNLLNNGSLNFQRSVGGDAGLATALYIQNSGNVGIGNTAPLTALDVTGSASLSANLSLRGSGTAHTFNILDNGSLNFQKSIGGDAGISNVLYLENTGNVGIGNTAPGAMLSVGSSTPALVSSAGLITVANTTDTTSGTTGSINTLGGLGITKSLWVGGSANSAQIFAALGTALLPGYSFQSSGTSDPDTGMWSSGANTVNFSTGGTEAMRITSGQKVGIGNTTPLTELDVTGSASLSANLSLRGSGTAHTFNILDNGSLNIQKSIGGDAGVATVLYLQNSGNVGIGTTAPGTTLDVRGNITILAGSDIRPTADSTTAIQIANAAGTDFVNFDTTNSRVLIGGAADPVPDSTLVVRLGNGGAGIKTVMKLQDNEGSAIGLGPRLTFDSSQVGGALQSFAAIAGRIKDNAVSTRRGELLLYTMDSGGAITEKVRIDDVGSVGIGNTAPLTALDVTGSASLSANLSLRGSGTAHTFNILDNGSLNFRKSIGGDASMTNVLYLENSGNVGIGNTAPGAMLSVGSSTPALISSGGLVTVANTTDTTSGTTGSINTLGGVGITKSLWVGGSANSAQIFSALGTALLPGYSFQSSGTSDPDTGMWSPAANTVAFSTGGTEAVRIDSSQRVGIANTTPLTALDVTGSASLSANLSLRGSGTAHTFNILDNGSLNFRKSIGGDAVMTNVLYLENSGNVGVGNTSPGAMLSVGSSTPTLISSAGLITVANTTDATSGTTGSMNTLGGVGITKSLWVGGSANSAQIFSALGTALLPGYTFQSSGTSDPNTGIFSSAADTVNFSTGGTEAMRITSGQKVGIGNTTPLTELDVTGSASLSANLSLRGSGTAHTFNILDNGTLNIRRSVGGDAAFASTLLFLQNNGNVGIGNTAPATTLDITGTGNVSTSLTTPIAIGGTGTTSTLTLRSTSGVGAAGADIIFQTGNNGATEAMRILNNGSVGIGTNSPNRLGLGAGNTTLTIQASTTDTSQGALEVWGDDVTNDSTHSRVSLGQMAEGVSRLMSEIFGVRDVDINSGAMTFRTANVAVMAEAMRITKDGNVGIGTVSPTNILSLGNAAARKFWIENTATDVVGRALTVAAGGTIAGTAVSNVTGGNLILQSGLGTGTGESTISFQTGTTLGTGTTLQTMSTKMTILGSGNVGIGDPGPDSLLDILSATTGTDLIITNTNATDTDVTVGFALTEGTNLFTMGVDDSDSDKFKISTTALGTSDRFVIDSSGFVGLGGQATPLTALDVTGSASLSANLSLRGSGTAHTFNILDNGSLNFQKSIGGDAGVATVLYLQNSGSVGIGNTAPSQTLHVTGGARITTSVAVTDDRTLCTIAASGEIEFVNGACGTSSQRYKENIRDLTYGLDDILRLKPVLFNYLKDSNVPSDLSLKDDRTKRRIGLIAEEVQEIIPEVVIWQDGQVENIDYAHLTALLIKGVQSLNSQIASNSAQVNSQLSTLNSQLASLTNALSLGNGNIGIGTTAPLFRLDVADMQIASAAVRIFNTDTGTGSAALVLKLGNTSTSEVASTNHFLNFETAGIGIVGSISGNGAKGVTYATSGIADFAEYFRKDPNQNVEFGSVMCLNESGFAVLCSALNSKILGIASERPAFLGGENLGNRSVAVGLVGQVETLVSNAFGEIKPGDALTSSDIPGVAVLATKAGQIVGKALEGLVGAGGKILVSVNVSWYDPTIYIASDGTLGGVQNTQNTQIAGESDISDAQTVGSADSPSVPSSLEEDPLFKDLKDKVSSLESKIDLLNLQFEQQASTSGVLAQIQSGQVLGASDSASLVQSLGDIEIYNATITDNLMVLGHTTVTSLGVTGNINAGLLSIHGLDGEINTLSGDLYLQKDALGGIDIFNGLIVMDTAGNMTVAGTITAQAIEAENYTVLGQQSIGSGTIPAGSTSIEVATAIATSSSKIFLTMTTLTDKQITVVEKKDGKFKVAIPEPTTSPISFDWWIVGNK